MNDISDLLRELFDRCGNNDTLDREFKKILQADVELQDEYKMWCNAHGYHRRDGYRNFVNELIESQDTIWDNYKEYGNEI